jgi:hypothetical protein
MSNRHQAPSPHSRSFTPPPWCTRAWPPWDRRTARAACLCVACVFQPSASVPCVRQQPHVRVMPAPLRAHGARKQAARERVLRQPTTPPHTHTHTLEAGQRHGVAVAGLEHPAPWRCAGQCNSNHVSTCDAQGALPAPHAAWRCNTACVTPARTPLPNRPPVVLCRVLQAVSHLHCLSCT